MGNSVVVTDDVGPLTCDWVSITGGKHFYENPDEAVSVVYSTTMSRWEVVYGGTVEAYATTNNGGANPPSYNAGAWSQSGNPTFAIYNISGSGVVLSAELVQFDVTTEGSKNHLTWQTASESQNKGFDIERSSPNPSKGHRRKEVNF